MWPLESSPLWSLSFLSSPPQPNPFKDSASSSCVCLRLEYVLLCNLSLRLAHVCKFFPLQVPYFVHGNELQPPAHSQLSHGCATSIGHCQAEHAQFLAVLPFSWYNEGHSTYSTRISRFPAYWNLLEPYSSKALCKSRHLLKLWASFFLNERISCFFLSVTVTQKEREKKNSPGA